MARSLWFVSVCNEDIIHKTVYMHCVVYRWFVHGGACDFYVWFVFVCSLREMQRQV